MIFAFTVTRANTSERAKLLLNTITEARRTAGRDFDWLCIAQKGTLAADVLSSALSTKLINEVILQDENIGQHVAWNMAYARAISSTHEYFLRLDDDIEFKTKRWLNKLVEASVLYDDGAIISPFVRGLNAPPRRSDLTAYKGIMVEYLQDAIGGICRIHPLALLSKYNYVSDVRLPLGSGDAAGIGRWCSEHTIPMVYLRNVIVKHAYGTTGQEQRDPAHFAEHDMFQHIPYIPCA